MANWSKKDYYQASESENEEEIAIEKLKQTTDLLQESDLFPEFQQEELNYNHLTEDELLEVIERDSPELMSVLATIEKIMEITKKAKKQQNEITLKYCKLLATHLSYYLFLKSKGKAVGNHPVITSIKTIEKIILSRDLVVKNDHKEPKNKNIEIKEKNPDKADNIQEIKKREVDEKIKRNKGIVKKRKKLERNVRVKNKMKYMKKVKIRRATLGISEPHNKERYQGETTGIRKNLIKSVKLT